MGKNGSKTRSLVNPNELLTQTPQEIASTHTLSQIEGMLENLEMLMIAEGTPPEEIESLFNQILSLQEGALNEKVKRICTFIYRRMDQANLQRAQADAHKQTADSVKKVAERSLKDCERLTGYLQSFLERKGVEKLDAGMFNLNIRAQGGAQAVEFDESYPLSAVALTLPECVKITINSTQWDQATRQTVLLEDYPERLKELITELVQDYSDWLTLEYNTTRTANLLQKAKQAATDPSSADETDSLSVAQPIPFARLAKKPNKLKISPLPVYKASK